MTREGGGGEERETEVIVRERERERERGGTVGEMVKETQSEALKRGFLRIGSSEKRRDEFLG